MTTVAVVPAAGSGQRLAAGVPKAFFHLDGRTLVERAVSCLLESGVVDRVVVAVPADRTGQAKLILGREATIVAGGAKTLASPRNDFEQDFILEQVRMSIRLHQTKRVLVMSHSDCATYGGLAHFKGDRAAEAEHHRIELHRAAQLLTQNFPDISVEPYFVKFDGIWEVLPNARPRGKNALVDERAS